MKFICIAGYLAAAMSANWLVTRYGQAGLIATAAVAIPFDLTARDFLHERWAGKRIWLRMGLLVAAGSGLSFLTASPSVCIASAISFAAAGIVDTIVYQVLMRRSRFAKMNASNACSAITDSILFPAIAFGAIDIWLSACQSSLKIAGGLFWTFILASGKQNGSN